MSRGDPSLPALLQSYFQQHLRAVRGASEHTVRAYRDALRLLLIFISDLKGRPVDRLRLEDLCHDAILDFLDHAERERGNSPATRNCRLAAIRSFVSHLLRHDLAHAEQYRRVLAIPNKRASVAPPDYLEPHEVRALLAQPQASSPAGERDLALLLFLYNTGARVSEALSVRVEDLYLVRPLQVRLHGKGRKDRLCAIWPETAKALRSLLRRVGDSSTEVFLSARGTPLTRDGVAYLVSKYARMAAADLPSLRDRRVTPHTLRHSCAVALLQAGVDLTVIRDYLGHVSVSTTGRYLSTNLQMKRQVLEAFWQRAGLTEKPVSPWLPTSDTLSFLNSL